MCISRARADKTCFNMNKQKRIKHHLIYTNGPFTQTEIRSLHRPFTNVHQLPVGICVASPTVAVRTRRNRSAVTNQRTSAIFNQSWRFPAIRATEFRTFQRYANDLVTTDESRPAQVTARKLCFRAFATSFLTFSQ